MSLSEHNDSYPEPDGRSETHVPITAPQLDIRHCCRTSINLELLCARPSSIIMHDTHCRPFSELTLAKSHSPYSYLVKISSSWYTPADSQNLLSIFILSTTHLLCAILFSSSLSASFNRRNSFSLLPLHCASPPLHLPSSSMRASSSRALGSPLPSSSCIRARAWPRCCWRSCCERRWSPPGAPRRGSRR